MCPLDTRALLGHTAAMNHPHYNEIVDALSPFHKCFEGVCSDIERMQLRACAVLGIPRRSERANDWHRAWRNCFGTWCEETGRLFEFIEEPDRSSLDYMVCHLLPERPFSIRFGRVNNGRIKRNGTRRQNGARAHGMLSSEFLIEDIDEPDPGELRQITLAYSLQDDFTEGGFPAWWMDRLVIGRETFDGFDELSEVATFSAPASSTYETERVVYVPREERKRWRRDLKDAMGGA